MAKIYIHNKTYEVSDGQNLLQACLSLGFDLPYFCWHPAMHSVGACRQCAVKVFRDEHDAAGQLVMSCMTPVRDGLRLSIDDPEAVAFRRGVVELLMVNHPHDCPVCDEGGECHLQDMTVMTGQTYRRFRFAKRTHRNQDLGPLVNHEMNRCIQCYRCLRFYRDYAGGRDFNVFGWHDHVYFGRQESGPLESEFSGNLVEICPTGVFTDKTFNRHFTRKWDLQTAPSICVHCSLGCNTIPGERYGTLRRLQARYNGQVNGYFLCDRGRYGYEFVNHPRRLRRPLLRAEGGAGHRPVAADEVLMHLAGLDQAGGRIIGIGSPRASLESNFALRTLVGPERFYSGLSDLDHHLAALALRMLREGLARAPSLHDVGQCDAALVLGEDLLNTAPLLALALRQAVLRQPLEKARRMKIETWNDAAVREALQGEKGPCFIATPTATKLDELATRTCRAAPDDLARFGFAVAELIAGDAASRSANSPGLRSTSRSAGDLSDELRALAEAVAQALSQAQAPLVIAGLSCRHEGLVQAAAAVATALSAKGRAAALCYTFPECNSLGAALLGGAPLGAAMAAVREGRADTVIILENDLYRRAEAAAVDEMLAAAGHVVALDHLASATTERAEVVLSAGTFADSAGTFVNNEGRAQRFYQVMTPEPQVLASWHWLRDMMAAVNRPEVKAWHGLDDIIAALAAALPIFKELPAVAPPAGFRVAGQKIPRQPRRYSGRTAMWSDLDVNEPQAPGDPDSALAFSMEGYAGRPPAALLPRFWWPGWNSPQAINKFQSEVGGALRGGDPGRRLIEPPSAESASAGIATVPAAFRSRPGQFLVIPAWHIFGSEELSVLSPGLAQLMPKAYLGMSRADAEAAGLKDGDEVELTVTCDGAGEPAVPPAPATVLWSRRLPVMIRAGLSSGLATLPVGRPDPPFVALPAWARLAATGRGELSPAAGADQSATPGQGGDP